MDKIKAMFTDCKDETANYTPEEISGGKAMAILSYIGILCLIPYFAEKNNRYVRFHAIQGLNLFLINVIYSVAMVVVSIVLAFIPIVGPILAFLLGLLSYGFIALAIMGIVYGFQDKAKEIPVVNKIKIVKQ